MPQCAPRSSPGRHNRLSGGTKGIQNHCINRYVRGAPSEPPHRCESTVHVATAEARRTASRPHQDTIQTAGFVAEMRERSPRPVTTDAWLRQKSSRPIATGRSARRSSFGCQATQDGDRPGVEPCSDEESLCVWPTWSQMRIWFQSHVAAWQVSRV